MNLCEFYCLRMFGVSRNISLRLCTASVCLCTATASNALLALIMHGHILVQSCTINASLYLVQRIITEKKMAQLCDIQSLTQSFTGCPVWCLLCTVMIYDQILLVPICQYFSGINKMLMHSTQKKYIFCRLVHFY